MSDETYQPKTYRKDGGDTIVVASGGKVDVEAGGALNMRGFAAQIQPTPNTQTAAVTLTIANLLTGIIEATPTTGATRAYTLPTGSDVDAGVTMVADDSFDWCLINLQATAATDTITVTAASSGHTIVGNAIVASANASRIDGSSAIFRTRKTAANTFVTYRIA